MALFHTRIYFTVSYISALYKDILTLVEIVLRSFWPIATLMHVKLTPCLALLTRGKSRTERNRLYPIM